jgi:hypothetical protein
MNEEYTNTNTNDMCALNINALIESIIKINPELTWKIRTQERDMKFQNFILNELMVIIFVEREYHGVYGRDKCRI